MTTATARQAQPTDGRSVDAFLGGIVEAVQPATGHHRAGLEAVLLAAALDTRITGTVVDLGAGCGVAGFCAAVRCRRSTVVLVERNPEAIECARAALARPRNADFAARVRIIPADIAAPEAERVRAGVGRDLADHVLVNPPFHQPSAARAPRSPARAEAHILDAGGLDAWFRAAASLLKFGGDMTAIYRADALATLLAAAARRFGAFDIAPIYPRQSQPAHRLLLRAVKGSRRAMRILPGLVLHHEKGNHYRPEVEGILRDGKGIASVIRAWHGGRGRTF